MYIKFLKWSKKEYSHLNKQFGKFKLLNNIQFYFPILSLFFHFHNNKNSKKIIDIDRRFRVLDVVDCNNINNYCSNKFIGCIVSDNHENSLKTKKLFLKSIPIIDIIHYCTNKYDMTTSILPSNFKFNYQYKINDLNNSAYIDTLFSYIAGELFLSNKTPSLAIFYGSYTGVGDFLYDISSEYSYVQDDTFFRNNLGKLYDLIIDDIYLEDYNSMSESCSDNSDDSDCSYSSVSSDNNSSIDSNLSNIILHIKNIPLQQIIIERLEGTLEDYLVQDKFDINIIVSCFFQITFCLCYLQKHYKFTHNDLHINNIMYTSTNKVYIYYKLNNKYFKVPTYGKIFKIIDFGRAIFDYNNKTYFSDAFSKYGEADGQYTYPIPNIHLFNNNNNKNNVNPNYSFDICRLSTSIIDELNTFEQPDTPLFKNFMIFITELLKDKNNKHMYEKQNVSFQLYIDLANNSCNGIPKDILLNPIFNIYNISKTDISDNHIYTLN